MEKKFSSGKTLVDYNLDLCLQAEVGNIEAVKKLLKISGIDINFEYGYPLNESVKKGNLEMVKLLFDSGAIAFSSAFVRAVERGYMEIVEIFITKENIDVNIGNGTPLRCAVKSNQPEMVEFLIKNGANVNVGSDISFESVVAYDSELVRPFLGREREICLTNDSAISAAVEMGHEEIAKILIENGADVSKCSDVAIATAVRKGYSGTVGLILNKFLKK